jgi:hypothetical protein
LAEATETEATELDSTLKQRVLTALERIELPTGACLGWVFARGWNLSVLVV